MPPSKKPKGSSIKNLLFSGAIAGLSGIVIISILFFYYATQIPDPSVIASRRVNESTKIYDTTGNTILYDVHGEERRTIIPFDQIPDSLKKATLAAEDSNFYNHNGIDIKGILRAVFNNFISLKISAGGSTITQQLVKNSLLGKEKTLPRKIKEAILSIELERKFTKDQILWMYLNQIPYGSNAYGVEAASQTFFHKHAKELTLGESAMMGAVIQLPSYYSPYGNHVKELEVRREYVLDRMLALNFITQNEHDTAIKEQPKITPKEEGIIAPHFVLMIKEYLEKKYGADIVENGGLQVVSTLNTDIQTIAQETVTKYGDINAKKYKANNAALTAIDPKTGHILAMVGSKDYFDLTNEGNFNVATAYRQPGSSFKPFAYATGFTKGYTDSTIFFDLKTEFNPNCDAGAAQKKDKYGADCYHPQNYTGTFTGPVTARTALQESLNIPAVEMLYLAGIQDTLDTAQKMGITFKNNDTSNFGLSVVLGGADVRLVDMVSAYGTFANDGIRNPAIFVQKVTSSDGTVLEEEQKNESRVLDSQITRLVSDVLSDNNARGPEFGYNSPLYISDRPVAAKTGTTQNNRDAWVLGYTPSLVAGVWTGNNNNTSMTAAGAGISAAGPMWHEFMVKALANTPVEYFTKPDPLPSSKPMIDGQYNTSQGIHSILYYVDRNDPLGAQPSNPARDPQFPNWEATVQDWVNKTGQQLLTPTPDPFIQGNPTPTTPTPSQ